MPIIGHQIGVHLKSKSQNRGGVNSGVNSVDVMRHEVVEVVVEVVLVVHNEARNLDET